MKILPLYGAILTKKNCILNPNSTGGLVKIKDHGQEGANDLWTNISVDDIGNVKSGSLWN